MRALAAILQALAIVLVVAGLMAWWWTSEGMYGATGGAAFLALTWASGVIDRAGKAPDAEQ